MESINTGLIDYDCPIFRWANMAYEAGLENDRLIIPRMEANMYQITIKDLRTGKQTGSYRSSFYELENDIQAICSYLEYVLINWIGDNQSECNVSGH